MDKSNLPKRTILLVDDHPINVDSYQTLLSSIESNKNAEYLVAFDCEQTYNAINKHQINGKNIDFAFIDINLPEYPEKKLFSGSDVTILIRKKFPLCKIIIISMHKEPNWVNQIFKSVNPEGFIAKSDINYKCFPEIFQSIEKNEIYMSQSIKLSQKIMIQKNINWDDYDSKILQLIAQGEKTINLPKFIPLSLSAIEKRKANIKKQLVLNLGSDKELIDVATNLGFL
ncbi:response regulator [Flavobacterium sp.]|jgi:DNA-binding NarL/FixJ family response regulator|uniref:response regulator n=1 Tax=Flavobacterium sp. TaxID=239 RepID=UPI0037C0146B